MNCSWCLLLRSMLIGHNLVVNPLMKTGCLAIAFVIQAAKDSLRQAHVLCSFAEKNGWVMDDVSLSDKCAMGYTVLFRAMRFYLLPL